MLKKNHVDVAAIDMDLEISQATSMLPSIMGYSAKPDAMRPIVVSGIIKLTSPPSLVD